MALYGDNQLTVILNSIESLSDQLRSLYGNNDGHDAHEDKEAEPTQEAPQEKPKEESQEIPQEGVEEVEVEGEEEVKVEDKEFGGKKMDEDKETMVPEDDDSVEKAEDMGMDSVEKVMDMSDQQMAKESEEDSDLENIDIKSLTGEDENVEKAITTTTDAGVTASDNSERRIIGDLPAMDGKTLSVVKQLEKAGYIKINKKADRLLELEKSNKQLAAKLSGVIQDNIKLQKNQKFLNATLERVVKSIGYTEPKELERGGGVPTKTLKARDVDRIAKNDSVMNYNERFDKIEKDRRDLHSVMKTMMNSATAMTNNHGGF